MLPEIKRVERPLSDRDTAAAPARDAERRQLTLMFCDLVNSVSLSTRLDPEDLSDVIGGYQRACMEPISRYGGHVARFVGDGILVFFGYPVAHEDDPERAIHAGLEIIEAVGRLNQSLKQLGDFVLRVRIGIATGLVVVGDITSPNMEEKDAVVGQASNLAARLQELASPNTVVVSPVTRELAAERFEYRDLGSKALKGFDKPISVYEVTAERRVSRFEARSATLTPFVGRDKEVAGLLQSWTRAASGNGQVVFLSGEAGIGKSRILAEARARIAATGHARGVGPAVTFQCSPHHENAPFYPIIRGLELLANFLPADTSSEKINKLRGFLEGADPTALALLADLLGISPEAESPILAISPTERRHLTIRALKEWCASRAARDTLLLYFEDVQWIDPTSKLLLKQLIDWAQTAGVLMVITLRTSAEHTSENTRRDFGLLDNGTDAKSHIKFLHIEELTDEETHRLMITVAQGNAISPTERDILAKRTEGVPLFIEELTRAFLKVREVREDKQRAALFVPETISDALMAQLDHLGRAKEIAQYASVIGHEFSLDLLARIVLRSTDDLLPDLNLLLDSNHVIAKSSDMYVFKHALVRDSAYESLLKKRRKEIHLRIAKELTQRASDVTDDLIAQHYAQGEAHSEAIVFWQRGARSAIARSAHEEAMAMLEAAMEHLPYLRGSASLALELDVVLSQAMALRSKRGYSAPEVEARLIRARELCRQCADSSNRFNVEWGLFQCNIVKGRIRAADEIADNLLEHAASHPDRPFADGHLALGMAAFHLGHFQSAMKHFEQGVNLSRPDVDKPHFFTHGQNPGIFCLSYLARTEGFLGFPDRARKTIQRGLTIARARSVDPGHVYTYVNALTFAVRTYQLFGDPALEKQLADEIVGISKRNHYAYYEALGICHLGWAMGAEGYLSEGIDKMHAGIAALERTDVALALPAFYTYLSQLYLRADRLDKASQALENAVARRHAEIRAWDAEIHRVRGEVLASRAPADLEGAESAYRSSLSIAQQQSARWLGLKASLSLSRLLQRTNRQREASEVLEGCLGSISEGFDTPEMRAAHSAMRELSD
ncbi:MAG TPA: AAA family ATPase [Stellaceae bacterium]|nr:AAA family ATPase [Stellaceae bacterium]